MSSQEGVSIEGEYSVENFVNEPSAESKHCLLDGFKKFGSNFSDAAHTFDEIEKIEGNRPTEMNRDEGIKCLNSKLGKNISEKEAADICDAIGLVQETERGQRNATGQESIDPEDGFRQSVAKLDENSYELQRQPKIDWNKDVVDFTPKAHMKTGEFIDRLKAKFNAELNIAE